MTRVQLFSEQLDAEDDDDDDDDDEYYNDEDFAETRFEEEDEASNYWHLKDYTFGRGVRNGHKDHEQRDDDEAGSANPWRKTGGLRLTRNEYHRFCDAQLECNFHEPFLSFLFNIILDHDAS